MFGWLVLVIVIIIAVGVAIWLDDYTLPSDLWRDR